MGKSALLFTAALLSLCFTPLYAQTGAAPASVDGSAPAATGPATITAPNHVTGYTAWDDDYLYIALQVNKPTLHGTNTEPFSNPLQDDAALISIQTDDDHNTTRPTAHTVLVAVSATGGIQLYSGSGKTPLFTSFKAFTTQLQDILENEKDPDKREAERAALLGKLIKYQVMPKGAKRETGTSMPGYTAEIGIPWTDLGGKPAAGTKMGFNVVTQSTTNDTPAVMSLSPSIQTLEGVDNPSLWGEILFSDAAKPSQNNLLICPYLISTKPVIDGEINEGEWNGLSAFVFDARGGGGESLSGVHTLQARSLPKFTPHPPRPVVPLAAPAETTALPPHRSQSLTHLVLARYDYDYQADPRKAAPIAQVVRGDGSTALAHHPFEGAGPWFSYDRADWHRQQLVNLRQAGIDVILPVYRGAPQDRRGYADKGLTVLAAALQNLRETGQDYPQVGLFFDGSDLTAASGGRPITRADLFTFIRDFYRHIPAPFRFIVPLSTPNGGRTACPIFLSHADAFTDLDASLVDYLRGRFAQEFDGADLLVLGTPDFKPKAALDGYFAETGDKGLQLIDGGWIKTASVGAGYDGELTAANGSDAAYRPRRNGDTYREDWMAAIGKQPDWVLVDGWNDYATASEVAPSF